MGWAGLIPSLQLTLLLLLAWPVSLFATDGHFLHGAGPVNEAMGGADTGICLDATGSIAWNPACSTEFKGHRFEIHGTLFDPWRSLSSTVNANASGVGMPGAALSGIFGVASGSDSGSASFNNGLLEVVFKLRDNTNKGYRRVRVV